MTTSELLTIAAAVVSIVVWLVRLEAKGNQNSRDIERHDKELQTQSVFISDVKERLAKIESGVSLLVEKFVRNQ